MTILVVFAAFLAPLLTSLLTGAFIAQGVTDRFWPIVIVRTATNAFAILTLVPLIAGSQLDAPQNAGLKAQSEGVQARRASFSTYGRTSPGRP